MTRDRNSASLTSAKHKGPLNDIEMTLKVISEVTHSYIARENSIIINYHYYYFSYNAFSRIFPV